MKKRVLSLVLTVAMIATLIPVAAFAADDTTTFPDMPNDWSTEALQNAIDNGLLNGIDGKIAASENLTRAQMAAIVTRAFGTNGSASLASFGDVNSGDWYYDAMAASVKMGAFKGDGNKLNPNVAITRQEAFTVLARLFTLTGADQSVLNGYTDGAKVADWAKDSMASMVKAGYVSGSDNMLNPTSNITRAEFAKVMDNLLKDYLAAGATEGKVTGNAILNKAGTLENVTVSGDLIVGDGAAEGDVTLKNVTVNGRLVVRGGGVNTVKLEGTTKVGSVVINKATGDVRLNNTTSTAVNVVVVSASATLTGKYDVVTLNTADTMLTAADATIATVNMNNEDTGLQLTGKSTVTTVNVNEDAKGAAVNVAKDSTIATVNSKADGVKMAGEGKITKANVSGNNNAVNTVGTTLVVSSGVTGTTSNGNDIKGGTTVTTAATGSKPTTGSSDSDWGWGDSTTTAEVATAAELQTAINEGKADLIKVTADIASDVTATRTASKSITIDFDTFTIPNLNITAENVTNITLKGTAAQTVTGTLTINAAKAHIANNIAVKDVVITAMGPNSYVATKAHTSITLNGGGTVKLSDDASAATVTVATGDPVTLDGKIDGKISVTAASAQTTIAGTVADVEVTGANTKLTVEKEATVATADIKATGAKTTVAGAVTTVTVDQVAEGAELIIAKTATVETATIAAPKAEATIAGTVNNVAVTETSKDSSTSVATKLTIESTATVSTASIAAEGAQTAVKADNVAVNVSAAGNEITVSGKNTTTSIDTTDAKITVEATATGTKVEATEKATSADSVVVKADTAVTVNAANESAIKKDESSTAEVTVKKSYKVTFNANGEGATVSPAYTMIPENTVIGTLPTPVFEGHTSKGWFTAATDGEAVTAATEIKADKEIFAQWTENKYTIAFNANGGTGTMDSIENVLYSEEKALTDNSFTRTGYTFTGWNTQADGKGTTHNNEATVSKLSATNEATVTLYAQWKIDEYNITYKDAEGATNENPESYTVEDAITLKDAVKTGYTFDGWYKGETKVTSIAKGSTGDLELTAKWTPITAVVTFDANIDGATGTVASKNVVYGEAAVALTKNAFAKAGYKFTGWNTAKDGSGTAYTDEQEVSNLTENVTLYAQWEKVVATVADLEAALKSDDTEITLTGDITLDKALEIASGKTVIIPKGKTLTVDAEQTLTIKGTLKVNGTLAGTGTITNNGTVFGYYNIANNTTITTSAGGSLNWLSGEAVEGVNTLLVGTTGSKANLVLTSGTFDYAKAADKVTYTLNGKATVQQAANGTADNATEPFVVGENETFIVDTDATLTVAAATDIGEGVVPKDVKPVLSVHATGGMLTVKGTLVLENSARVVLGNDIASIKVEAGATLNTEAIGEYDGTTAAGVDGILDHQHKRLDVTVPTVE